MIAAWQLLAIFIIFILKLGLASPRSDILFGGSAFAHFSPNNAQQKNQTSLLLEINQQTLMLPTRDGGKINKMMY